MTDSVPAEFPVEAPNGSILILRDRQGLLQVDAWDPKTGLFSPASAYPTGTFYLHRAAPDIIVSVAHTGPPGERTLSPAEMHGPVPEFVAAPDTGIGPPGDSAICPVQLAAGKAHEREIGATAAMPAAYRAPGFLAQTFLWYRYERPYSYNYVHPLLTTDLEAGFALRMPDAEPLAFWYGRQTVPLWSELTGTLRYRGQWMDLETRVTDAELPDGNSVSYSPDRGRGHQQDVYAGLDFPLYKGYLLELPLLGPWNYAGGGVYWDYLREDYREHASFATPGYAREQAVAGAKLSMLFFPLRRTPLVISPAIQWDLREEEAEFRFRLELGGISDTYNLRASGSFGLSSHSHAELGSGRHRGL